ncbi:MAG: phage holin family protein [Saprospiraceae bacterium]|nr:phage holin family protein [Saprospiraceae bacterium]
MHELFRKNIRKCGETVEYARQYAHQQIAFYKLELAERLAKSSSALVTSITIAFTVILAMAMLSAAAGLYLGMIWGSYVFAFLFIAGMYFLAAFFLYVFRKQLITNPILSIILKSFCNNI